MVDILIVEDNKELCGLLSDFLRLENYTVSIAETGEKALSLYEKYGARLVVLLILCCRIMTAFRSARKNVGFRESPRS